MILYFVKLPDRWHTKPFNDYKSAIEFATKKFTTVYTEVYELNLDNLGKKNLVWKKV
jgi:hypothetical protein